MELSTFQCYSNKQVVELYSHLFLLSSHSVGSPLRVVGHANSFIVPCEHEMNFVHVPHI